jgi:hypothetical protein
MPNGRGVSEEAQEIWTKVSRKWQGDDANAFYREYSSRIIEASQQFESSCGNLKQQAEAFSKELQLVYQNLQK